MCVIPARVHHQNIQAILIGTVYVHTFFVFRHKKNNNKKIRQPALFAGARG